MSMRAVTLLIGGLDTLAWIWLAAGTFFSSADPATRALDTFAGWLITILFVITAVPALILAGLNRWPRRALALSLAFPGGFMLLFIVAVIVFA